MKRSLLEELIGKNVVITLFDNDVQKGILEKTNSEKFKDNMPWLFDPRHYYFVNKGNMIHDYQFMCSHVKKCIETSDMPEEPKK